MWKEVVMAHYPGIYVDELEKTIKNLRIAGSQTEI
jgi:hypothetical protein